MVWSYGHGSPLQHLLSCGWLAAFPCSPSSSLISPLKPLTSHNTSTIDHGFINKLRWVPIWIIIMEGGALTNTILLVFSFLFLLFTSPQPNLKPSLQVGRTMISSNLEIWLNFLTFPTFTFLFLVWNWFQ